MELTATKFTERPTSFSLVNEIFYCVLRAQLNSVANTQRVKEAKHGVNSKL